MAKQETQGSGEESTTDAADAYAALGQEGEPKAEPAPNAEVEAARQAAVDASWRSETGSDPLDRAWAAQEADDARKKLSELEDQQHQ